MLYQTFACFIFFLTLVLNSFNARAMDDDLWPERSPSPTPRLRQKRSFHNEDSHKIFMKSLLKATKDKSDSDVDELLNEYLRKNQTLNLILHSAITKNQHHIVRYLVTKQREKIVINTPDEKGHTALHKAARNGSSAIVDQILLLEPDINSKTRVGNTPLHAAAKKGHIEAMKSLFRSLKIGLEERNLKQQTPLVVAVENAQLQAYNLLVRHNANIHVISREGTSLLHSAVHTGYLPIVLNLLCTHKLDTCSRDGHNRTPYDIAKKNDDTIMIANLESYLH